MINNVPETTTQSSQLEFPNMGLSFDVPGVLANEFMVYIQYVQGCLLGLQATFSC